MNIIVKILISVVMININYNLIKDLKNRVFNILSNCNEIKLLKNFSIIYYKNNKKGLFNKKLEIFKEAQKILGILLIILPILIINIFIIFPNIIYVNYINTLYIFPIFFIILYIILFYKLFFKYTVSVYFITLLIFLGISLIIFSVIQNIILTFSLMMSSILLFYIITYFLFSIDFFKKINICLKISVIFMIVINILLYYLINLLKNYYWIFFIISICIMILLSIAPFMMYIIMYNKNNRENLYKNFFGKEITQFFILLFICVGILTFSLFETYLDFKNFIPFFTLEEYIKENNSNIFKSIINYLTIKRKLNDILFLVSIVSGTYFLIGEILVYFKIKKYKEKAQEIYEDIIMNERYYYEQMKKCVYYGEEEYRNLFFNNDKIRKIIKQNEKYYKDNN